MDVKAMVFRRAHDMLEAYANNDPFFVKVWSKGPSCLRWVLQGIVYEDSLCTVFNDNVCFNEIADSMNEYLEHLPTTPIIKNRYREHQ